MSLETTETPPVWYKQFWPWFLITLPAIAVIGGITIVVVAFTSQPELVKDDYYRSGLEINEVLKQDQKAAELNLKADILLDREVGELVIDLSGDFSEFPPFLVLKFLHTQKARSDHWVKLRHIAEGRYTGDLGQNRLTRWYLRLTPAVEGNDTNAGSSEWRLTGQINTTTENRVTLLPLESARQ